MNVPKGREDEPLEILWEDAAARAGWDSEPMTISKITSVGYLIHEDKKQVCLANSLSVTSITSSGQVAIPRSCILRMRRFKRPKGK